MKRQHTLKREYTTKEDWLEDFLTNSNSKASLKSTETAVRTFDIFVKVGLTPMISSLSLMENTESESEVLRIGISVIMLNIGMYLRVPDVVIVGIRKRI
jgi:hypothetical protein